MRIYFIRISRLKFAKFEEYFKNKPEAEILKRINNLINYFVCWKSVNPMQKGLEASYQLEGRTYQRGKIIKRPTTDKWSIHLKYDFSI